MLYFEAMIDGDVYVVAPVSAAAQDATGCVHDGAAGAGEG
jgi:hypothetical protein